MGVGAVSLPAEGSVTVHVVEVELRDIPFWSK